MAHPGPAQHHVAALCARHPQIMDMVLGAFFAFAYLLFVRIGDRAGLRPGRDLFIWDVLAAATTFGLIAARRHWPRAVLAVAVVAGCVSMAAGESRAATLAAAAIAAYTVATANLRRTAWLCGGAAALLLYAASIAWPDRPWPGEAWWERGNGGVVAVIGMAVAVGDAIRTRRAYVAAVEERARRAEESRDEEARRRVMQERLRIARELHDVVAHHLALISVQAGVATHLMQSKPDKAAAALGHVRQAANTAVEELGTVLAVLRQDDDPDHPTDPAPGLSQLPSLLDNLAAAGLRVHHRQDGEARPLPAAADLAAYRIIQESLTNAHKHAATAEVRLRMAYTDDSLTIDVTNAHSATPDDVSHGGTGHGLIGMRERATAVGGTLHAGPVSGDTFAVHAVVPAAKQAGASR